MSKHTPGPWEIEEESEGHSITNRAFTGDEWCIAEVYGKTDTSIANANLIAAAPDLLEALLGVERLCAASGYIGVNGQYLKIVRAAIAKARGEA